MAQDSARSKPVLLHVIHGLGGGSERWLADFSAADPGHTHLVLRPLATSRAMANGVALYGSPTEETPLQAWTFERAIAATALGHAEYRAALDEIMASHGVGALMVSSLIGHSLEVLQLGVPTVFVCHDYYPWCPAINLYFGEVCGHCDGERLARCSAENPDYNPFENFGAEERAALRERFVEVVRAPHVKVVAPSASVGRNLKRLEPRFADMQVTVIEHG